MSELNLPEAEHAATMDVVTFEAAAQFQAASQRTSGAIKFQSFRVDANTSAQLANWFANRFTPLPSCTHVKDSDGHIRYVDPQTYHRNQIETRAEQKTQEIMEAAERIGGVAVIMSSATLNHVEFIGAISRAMGFTRRD